METAAHIYPLKLSYVAKTALWGGRTLKDKYGKTYDGDKLAETWELACRTPKECSAIENGPLAGMLLLDYFEKYGKDLIAKGFTGDRFPLLIKWIDAADRLSVQVHPDDAYAAAHENDPGKTEMWYIAEAEEGARLIYGLRDGMTASDFRRAVEEGKIGSAMRELPVRRGETYFIPSGMLHAIGAGIVIAEIQQNSDLTYRVYDYERRGADGKLRELHVAKALDVVRPFTEKEVDAIRFSRGKSEDTLAACPYFRVKRIKAGEKHLTVTDESFMHLLCTAGEGTLIYKKERIPVKQGDSFLLPASLGDFFLEGGAEFLLSSL